MAKQVLSRKKVLSKAVALADRSGVSSISMRKLAAALNVEAMSLYNHVDNKEDLLDGMVDLVALKFELPEAGKPWQAALRKSVISTHEVLLQHPWAALQLLSRVSIGEGMMTYSNACYGCLFEAGFSHAMVDYGWNTIHNHLYGFTLTEINSPVDPKDYSNAVENYLPMVPEERYPYIHSMMQLIINQEHSGVNDFTFGLDLILDALERKR